MAFLKVLNVQQGDCMTIRPTSYRKFHDALFYVDLGNGQFDVSKEIKEGDQVHLILTHSHRDHIYGFSYMLPYIDQIVEIVLPYCFNEICLIAKAIMNLKGMRTALGCEELKKELIDINSAQRILKNSLAKKRTRIIFAYDGMSLCDHIRFLNPPLPQVPFDWLNDVEYQKAEAAVNELYETEFAKDFLGYVNSQWRAFDADHAPYRDFIANLQDENYESALNRSRAGCKMILKFMFDNFKAMSAFNESPDKAKLNKIVGNFNNTAHDACLVMMLSNGGMTYLLGGDASKKVFYRLIKQQSIHAHYFKIPHHGSYKNLDDKILEHVAPKIAIISHGNAKFGRARDTHPDQKVLDLLLNRNVVPLVTNDVIKKGKVVLAKTAYSTANLEIE